MAIIKELLYISWKNVFRNKRRSALTLLILVLGSTGIILIGGYFDNLIDRLRESFIWSQSGHIEINKMGFLEKGASDPFNYLIPNQEKLITEVEGSENVQFTAPQLILEGMLTTEKNNISVMVLGVDPAKEMRLLKTSFRDQTPYTRILQGDPLSSKDPNGILIATELSQALDLKIGDLVTFLTTREGGGIEGAEFNIRGIYQAGLKSVGERLIKVPLATAQDILGTPKTIHKLIVYLDRTSNTPIVLQKLSDKLKNNATPLSLVPWYQQGKVYHQTKSFLLRIYHVVQVIISIVFFFSIANTINMALFERMREYGTMMALGNPRWTIQGVIFLEACFLGLMGGVLGIVLGGGIGEIVSSIGIPMPDPPLTTVGYGGMLVQIQPNFLILLESFMIAFFATLLSSLIPAYRASHYSIVKALGYV